MSCERQCCTGGGAGLSDALVSPVRPARQPTTQPTTQPWPTSSAAPAPTATPARSAARTASRRVGRVATQPHRPHRTYEYGPYGCSLDARMPMRHSHRPARTTPRPRRGATPAQSTPSGAAWRTLTPSVPARPPRLDHACGAMPTASRLRAEPPRRPPSRSPDGALDSRPSAHDARRAIRDVLGDVLGKGLQ